jgi:hypothetical protein
MCVETVVMTNGMFLIIVNMLQNDTVADIAEE